MKKILYSILIVSTLMLSLYFYSMFSSGSGIGSVKTSGLFFKDSISIKSFADPTVKGIACHITTTDKAFSLDEQTDSSIACRQVESKISGNYKENKENIFSESKGLFFKKMRVDRFYDPEFDTLIYIAYVKKVQGENASHSISTVPLFNAK
jgi:CreA protein